MFGEKNDLILPALLGLGFFAQNQNFSLCNNTVMLLLLYIVLTDHEDIEDLRRCTGCGCGCDGGRRGRWAGRGGRCGCGCC